MTTARGRFVPPPRHIPLANAVSLACDDKVSLQEQREAPRGVLARAATWISRNVAEGLVSRQEVVSAVPVSMLDVQPGHSVLDLCASPGSETLEALELEALLSRERSSRTICLQGVRTFSATVVAGLVLLALDWR